MRKFFELLQTKGSLALIGLLIGLFCGFRVANARYRTQQLAAQALPGALTATAPARDAGAANATQQQTSAILDKAKANPQDFEAQMAAADQFLQIKRPDGALAFLTQANQLKPADSRPMSALATAYLLSGKYPEAIQWSRAAMKRKPADLGNKVLLMFALIEARQQLGEAEQLLTQIEKVRPNDEIIADARRALGEAKAGGAPMVAAPANEPGGAPPSAKKSTLDHGPAVEKPTGQ